MASLKTTPTTITQFAPLQQQAIKKQAGSAEALPACFLFDIGIDLLTVNLSNVMTSNL
ncbi:MAG: hypothetical protein HHJ12_15900 [Glaciimonas sp.]|nr:hypothetical protein [Glaciimonas sp.]